MHIFPKGINTVRIVNNLVQDLNSGHRGSVNGIFIPEEKKH